MGVEEALETAVFLAGGRYVVELDGEVVVVVLEERRAGGQEGGEFEGELGRTVLKDHQVLEAAFDGVDGLEGDAARAGGRGEEEDVVDAVIGEGLGLADEVRDDREDSAGVVLESLEAEGKEIFVEVVAAVGAAVGEESFAGLVEASGGDLELLRDRLPVGGIEGFGTGEDGVRAEGVGQLEEDAGRADEDVGAPGEKAGIGRGEAVVAEAAHAGVEAVVVLEKERDAETEELMRRDDFAENIAGPAGAFGGGGDEDGGWAGGAGGEAEAIGREGRDAGGELLFGVGASLGLREAEGWGGRDAERAEAAGGQISTEQIKHGRGAGGDGGDGGGGRGAFRGSR